MKQIFLIATSLLLLTCNNIDQDFSSGPFLPANQTLQPWSKNSNWWSWDGETPTLLLGASDSPAPFLTKNWRKELEYLKKTGGNYVAIKLPALASGISPFSVVDDGSSFKLDKYNDQYWKKLDEYLSYASGIGVVIEIEVWDQEGIEATQPDSLFWTSPNATPQAFGMLEGRFLTGEHPFFQTVPDALGYRKAYNGMLNLQRGFVDQLLSVSLPYRNVIYNVQVARTTEIPWMVYWGRYIEAKAEEKGLPVNINLGVEPPARINVARFNQRLITGASSAFHRPRPNGNGMNGSALTSIRGARIVERHLKFWDLRPAPEILLEEETIASAATDGKGNYLLYLPGAGSVNLSPDWDDQVPVRVTVVGYLGTQKSELLEPPYGDSFRLFTEEVKGGWMILEPQ